MLDISNYQTDLTSVNSTPPAPFRGRYAVRSLKNPYEAAFAGADLYRGVKRLVEPSLAQCAFITNSDVSSAWWALHREDHRKAIIAHDMSLIPPRKKPVPPVPIVNDAEIVDFVRRIGVGRVLDVAKAAE